MDPRVEFTLVRSSWETVHRVLLPGTRPTRGDWVGTVGRGQSVSHKGRLRRLEGHVRTVGPNVLTVRRALTDCGETHFSVV